MVAELSRVELTEVEIDVSGARQDKPPRLTEVHFEIGVRAEADEAKLGRLLGLAERNSTVVSTLRMAIPVSGGIRKI
jgi:uncharacterized OsmC-like protein